MLTEQKTQEKLIFLLEFIHFSSYSSSLLPASPRFTVFFSALSDNVKIIHENQVSNISIVCSHIMHSHPELYLRQHLWTLTQGIYNTGNMSLQSSDCSCFLELRLFPKYVRHFPVTTGARNDINNATEDLRPQMNKIYQGFLLISNGSQCSL